MISGSTRGKGGRNLSSHLLEAEADQTTHVIPPRGVVTRGDLHQQLAELVVAAKGSRTDRPCYHVHCDPPPDAPASQVVLDAYWKAFETEFGLTGNAYVGAQHVKHGRAHEHRVYSLVQPDGRVADTRNDYARRTFVSLSVAYAFGLTPAPTPHAASCAHRFVKAGRPEIAVWLAEHGLLNAKALGYLVERGVLAREHGIVDRQKPVAPSTPQERLMEARTGVAIADVRAAALEAWLASHDGESLRRELAARGLTLAMGTVGPVVVDKAGTPHALTRVIGAASRLATGERIPAAAVKARVSGLKLENWNGRVGVGDPRAARSDRSVGDGAVARRGGAGPGVGAGRTDRAPGERRGVADLRGERSRKPGLGFTGNGARAFARARLSLALKGVNWKAVHDARDLAEELRAISSRKVGPWVPGQTDLWGVPL